MSEQEFNEAKSSLAFSQNLIDQMRQPAMEESDTEVMEQPMEEAQPGVEEPQPEESKEEKPEEKIDVEKMINDKVSGLEEKITAKIEKKLTDALDES